MKLIDSRGRIFGIISLLDLGAALIILMVAVGIFVLPGSSGKSIIAQANAASIELTAIVRGLNVLDPQVVLDEFKAEKTNIIIRNQPAGQVEVVNVQELPRNLAIPQPDGSVKSLPDPRPESNYSRDMLLTLKGRGDVTSTGMVLGGQKVKIGTVLELEGKNYNFNASVVGIKQPN
ncbi:DUF4330 domain-containing protein [Synechocystis salina LEGE 06099]|uniref:DUF4330 domain-containing protein n=1 Tax=Synechocystis salina TaxID=945780 RepID=UPI00187E309D|nr:DUF4330 domain-containing protein [Synechocystis salina]MBE9203659.1 DUF4330 domain-containing protein [Synechocystis salina LEGE 06099]